MFLRVKEIQVVDKADNSKEVIDKDSSLVNIEGEDNLVQVKDIKKIKIDRLSKDFAEVKCRFIVTLDKDYYIPEFKVKLSDSLAMYSEDDMKYVFIVLLGEILSSGVNCINVGKSIQDALNNYKTVSMLVSMITTN